MVVHQTHARIPFEVSAGCEIGPERTIGQPTRSNGRAFQHRRDLVNQVEERPKHVQKRDVLEFEEVAHAVGVKRDHRALLTGGSLYDVGRRLISHAARSNAAASRSSLGENGPMNAPSRGMVRRGQRAVGDLAAEARDGHLVHLRSGRSRDETITDLIADAEK